MTVPSSEQVQWLGRCVLPHERALRSWLGSKRFRCIDVDDVVQETYAVLAGLDNCHSIVNPRAYAFATAFSIATAQIRRAKYMTVTGVDDLHVLAGVDIRPSPETEVSDREQLQRLGAAIAELPPRCRAVFILCRVRGLPQREVAQKLGIGEGTVEKHMHKALLALKQRLDRGAPPQHTS